MEKLNKGFTLIELLVIITILGILAVVLAPKLREQLAKAKDSKAIQLLAGSRAAASAAFTEKMVVDNASSTSSGIVVNFADVKLKLDSRPANLITENGATQGVAIGGSRTVKNGDVAYGGQITMTIVTDGAIILVLPSGIGQYSTEGKLWDEY